LIFLRRARHVAFMIAPFALAVGVGCSSHQRLQAPAEEQQNEAAKDARKRADEEQAVPPTRVVLDDPVTVVSEPDPKQEERVSEQRAQTRFANSVQIGTLFFAAVAAIGAVCAWWANRRSANAEEDQVRLLTDQVADTKRDAAEQRRIALEALVETRRSAEAAAKSAEAAKTSADSLKNSERAYVVLKHWSAEERTEQRHMGFHPLRSDKTDDATGLTKYRLHIRVKNSGRTPATVLYGMIQRAHNLDMWGDRYEPPLRPEYVNADERIPGTLLHANDHYFRKLNYSLNATECDAIGAKKMWLVGYVVYVDRFGATHRGGFCRHVNDALAGKNNLEIDDVSLPYNYDYEIDENGKKKR
jgi:hypothetical protein